MTGNEAPALTIDEGTMPVDTEGRTGPLGRSAPVGQDQSVPTVASPFRVRKVVRSEPLTAAGPRGQAARHAPEAGHRVARNLSALFGGQVVTWTMTLVWTLIVPRALGPVGLGILVSAQSVSGVLGIVLGMGTRNYLVREIVINRDAGPKLVGHRARPSPHASLRSSASAAVVWAHVAHYGHEATIVLYLITAMTVLTLLLEPLQAAFQAIERMKYLAYVDIVNKSAQSIIGIALVIIGFKVVGIAANMAIIAGARDPPLRTGG